MESRPARLFGLGDYVRFDGPLNGEAKEAAFRSSELFILPTHSEDFGIAVAEACRVWPAGDHHPRHAVARDSVSCVQLVGERVDRGNR